jgi:hypothetical protein
LTGALLAPPVVLPLLDSLPGGNEDQRAGVGKSAPLPSPAMATRQSRLSPSQGVEGTKSLAKPLVITWENVLSQG